MPKKYKIIDWTEHLDQGLAYTAKEISELMGMNILTTRRYLRRSVAVRMLDMRPKGRIHLYALPKRDAENVEEDSQ